MSNFVKLHEFRAEKRTKIRISEVGFQRGAPTRWCAPYGGVRGKAPLKSAARLQTYRSAHYFEQLLLPLGDMSNSERAYPRTVTAKPSKLRFSSVKLITKKYEFPITLSLLAHLISVSHKS